MMIKIPEPKERREATKRLMELSGQDLTLCLQCGKCTSGCPFADDMDYAPHQLSHLAQLGLIADLISCDAIWYCATCFTCRSRCPVSIDIAALAEAVRLIRQQVDEVEDFGPDRVSEEIVANAPQQAIVSLYRKFGN